MIQRIIESTGDDEAMLFEALNLHDELQQILAKYEELKIANLPETGDTVKESGPSAGLMRDDEAKEQQTPKESESTSQSRDSEKVE